MTEINLPKYGEVWSLYPTSDHLMYLYSVPMKAASSGYITFWLSPYDPERGPIEMWSWSATTWHRRNEGEE